MAGKAEGNVLKLPDFASYLVLFTVVFTCTTAMNLTITCTTTGSILTIHVDFMEAKNDILWIKISKSH